jgi:hypothetical protein
MKVFISSFIVALSILILNSLFIHDVVNNYEHFGHGAGGVIINLRSTDDDCLRMLNETTMCTEVGARTDYKTRIPFILIIIINWVNVITVELIPNVVIFLLGWDTHLSLRLSYIKEALSGLSTMITYTKICGCKLIADLLIWISLVPIVFTFILVSYFWVSIKRQVFVRLSYNGFLKTIDLGLTFVWGIKISGYISMFRHDFVIRDQLAFILTIIYVSINAIFKNHKSPLLRINKMIDDTSGLNLDH